MSRYRGCICILSAVLTFCGTLPAQQPDLPSPKVVNAVDGVLDAFHTHPLVGIGDWHGLAQEEDFYADLIKDPRFGSDVGNIVIEFGDASQQQTIDRYVAGEDIPYDQLRKVWTDTVGWIPTVTALGYINLFAQIRAVNMAAQPSRRIHVWLGDPPIDWSQVKTRADVKLSERERFPATLIKTQILAGHKKALVIYGTFHFYDEGALRAQVEAVYPNAFFIVTPYIGFQTKACSEQFESAVHGWPVPAFAAPVRNTTLQNSLQHPGCSILDPSAFHLAPSVTQSEREKALAIWEDESSGITGDALLYLGPAASLMNSPSSPDLYLDLIFRDEINRRRLIMSGRPLPPAAISTTPRYLHSYGGPSHP